MNADSISTTLLLDVVIKVSLLLFVVWLGSLLIRKRSAAAQHRWWTLGFIGSLLIPAISLVTPTWTLPILPSPIETAATTSPSEMPLASNRALVSPTPNEVIPSHAPLEPATSPRPILNEPNNERPIATASNERRVPLIPSFLLSLWLMGLTFCGLRTLWQRFLLWRLLKHCIQLGTPEWNELLADCSQSVGLSRKVALLQHQSTHSPVSAGAWNPAVILPNDSESWDRERRRLVLLHELAHVQRRDVLTQTVAGLACGLYWFQPLCWYGLHQMRKFRELACDDLVLSCDQQPSNYADVLLDIARSYRHQSYPFAVGMARSSNVETRILAILDKTRRHVSLSRTGARLLLASALALICVVGTAQLRSQAEPVSEASEEVADETRPVVRPRLDDLAATCMTEHPDGSITYSGFVTNAATEEPIGGVEVRVYRKLSRDPKTQDWRTLETTVHKTDADGIYQFTLPAEQTAEGNLYLEVEAQHPGFAAMGRSGYSHGMIRKNLTMGETPFYCHLELWAGEAIEGTVVSPDDQPLEGVKIFMYSAPADQPQWPRKGAFSEVFTDQEGRFRIVPPTPGDGVIWILPKEYEPQSHRLGDRRGDWGRFKVRHGVTISGQVIDTEGKPIADVRIDARRTSDGEKPDEFLNNNAVSRQIGRSSVSDKEGMFSLASLPSGEYELRFSSNSESYDPAPLEHVLPFRKVTVKEGEPLRLIIQAAPHVTVYGTYVNSKGEPRSGHQVTLWGYMNGDFYATESSRPNNNGRFEIKAPRGLSEAKLDLITNEHSALRWRRSPGSPLRRGSSIELGKLEEDLHDLEVVRYAAPTLLVKVVDENGTVLRDFKPRLLYTNPAIEEEDLSVYTRTNSHISFEKQGDGRERSSQLLPNEPFSITVVKPGFTTETHELALQEGEQHEIKFVLRKVITDEQSDNEQSRRLKNR